MAIFDFPHLTAMEDEAEFYLIRQGIPAQVSRVPGALRVTVDDPDLVAAQAALAAWQPVFTRTQVPDRWRTHLGHLRDFREGVRAGTLLPTDAQRDHALADLIDLLAHLFEPLDFD